MRKDAPVRQASTDATASGPGPAATRLVGPIPLTVRAAVALALLLAAGGAALTAAIGADLAAANAREQALSEWFVGIGDASPLVHGLAQAVSWLGDEQRTVPIVAFVAMSLLLSRRPLWAGYLVAVTLGGVAISSATKQAVGRPRPPLVQQPVGEELLSFPSGHTFAGVTVWGSVAIIALVVLPPRWRAFVAVVAAAIGLLQAPSRLVLGRHWPTDVVGSWLIAGAWLLLCLVAVTWVATALARRR